MMKEKIFKKLFEEAEIAKFTPTELREYEDSLKAYRDVKNSIDTALEQGREQGRAEGMAKGRAEGRAEGLVKGRAEGVDLQKQNTAKMMLANGEPVDKISLYTGLTIEEIEKL